MSTVQIKEALRNVFIARLFRRFHVHAHSAAQRGPTTRSYSTIYRRIYVRVHSSAQKEALQ
jgi:hypothetical protein